MEKREHNFTPLGNPLRIAEQVWPEGTIPLVTIQCTTYNHVGYIREAVEGFLMQETVFPVEILIHDDASTDGTSEIVSGYENKHPQLIRCFVQPENTYTKPNKHELRQSFRDAARGEYIARCEGDDYWCDPQKLQLQLNVLINSQDAVGCCHDIELIGSGGLQPAPKNWFVDWGDRSRLTLEDVISYRAPFHTSSFFVRKSAVIDYDQELIGKSISGDLILFVLAASRGDIFRINRPMSVYRSHPGGVTKSDLHRDSIYFLLNRIRMWRSLKRICIRAEDRRLALERLHMRMLLIELFKRLARGELMVLIRFVRYLRSLHFL